MIFPYFLRVRFPSYIYLRCQFQGFHLNKEGWAAPGSTEVAFPHAGEGRGLGQPWCLPSCRLPASRWLPLSDGSERLFYLVLRRKSLQSSENPWQLCLQTCAPTACQPKWLLQSTWKSSARLRGGKLWCCCERGTSAEPSSLWEWNQTLPSLLFSPLTKDARCLRHPERVCLFVLKVQVGIQTWQLVLTSRSWANVPGPTNWNSGIFWIPIYSRQRLCSGSLMTKNNVPGFYIHYKILIESWVCLRAYRFNAFSLLFL